MVKRWYAVNIEQRISEQANQKSDLELATTWGKKQLNYNYDQASIQEVQQTYINGSCRLKRDKCAIEALSVTVGEPSRNRTSPWP